MKTIKLLLLILTLFSFQAGATGYAHNMFVAHRKLQAGKDVVVEKTVVKKAKSSLKAKQTVQVKLAPVFVHVKMTSELSDAVTLNERVLEEGPASFFSSEKEENDESVVTKLVAMVRCVIYAFIGSPQLRNS